MFVFIDATVYVGGLDDKVSESIMWELFLQAGPVSKCCVNLRRGLQISPSKVFGYLSNLIQMYSFKIFILQ